MKVAYEDFWPRFVDDVKNQDGEWYFGEFLPSLYDVEIDYDDPDTLIFSIFGNNHGKEKYGSCKKVYYSAENIDRNYGRFRMADYTISHHIPGEGKFGGEIEEETHLQMPIYLRVFGPDRMRKLQEGYDVEKEFERKEKFCCLVTRHEHAPVRGEVFHSINKNYKKLDSAGKGWNNMDNGWTVPGGWLNLKDFASQYKFMIAVENREVVGYCSEKLYNAIRCRTVPIYWGNPKVDKLFNSDAFVNVSDFDSYDELVKYIEYLDNNDETFKKMLSADPFPCPVEEHPVYNKCKIESKTKKIFD